MLSFVRPIHLSACLPAGVYARGNAGANLIISVVQGFKCSCVVLAGGALFGVLLRT